MSTLFASNFTKINQISPQEQDFTEVLEAIALKPKILYYCGKLPKNMTITNNKVDLKDNKKQSLSTIKNRTSRPKTVAIVGSRHGTKYGEEIAYNLARELSKKGVIVVSGLAFGIDTAAHRGCLDAGGVTIAVLGTRIDHIYPRAHLDVARRIIEKSGAIISEYAPSSRPEAELAPGEYIDDQGIRRIEHKVSFLHRNRLISGLSDIVVIVEAAEKSGSLNTATHALEQGKTVFAVPGNINNPYSQGCNKLLRQGAIPYTSPDDILRELFPEDYLGRQKRLHRSRLVGDNDVETKVLQAISSGLRSGEEIMAATHLPPEVFNQAVTILEIKSRLRPLGMNNWSLI